MSIMEPAGVAELIFGVFGVVGTGFGVKQYIDMKRLEKRTEEQTRLMTEQLRTSEKNGAALTASLNEANEQIGIIRTKMVTIAVAKFPMNLNSLMDLMDSTQSELEIVCDFVGYAMYSNVSGFQRYFDALERAVKRGVKVRLLLYGLDVGRQAIGKQLPPSDYPRERSSTSCAEYFQHWHEGRACPDSYNEFRDTLLRDEEELIAKLQGVEVRVMDHSLVTFVWIADQTRGCIFSFRNDGDDEGGMTFQSHDGEIVTNFRAVFDAEWKRASAPLYKSRW